MNILKAFFAALFSILFVSCYSDASHYGIFTYEYKSLDKAWAANDSIYLREWINHLEKENFEGFRGRMTEFATKTNFCYGYFDEEKPISQYSKREQSVYKHNCIAVNKIYINSPLFLNKRIPFDSTLFIQENYWLDNEFLSNSELAEIKFKMSKACEYAKR